MPLISQPILELPQHVFLPIIQTTTHRILQSLAMQNYIGDKIYIKTDFTTHSKTDDQDNNTFTNAQSFTVDANIQMNPSSQKWDFYTFHHTTAYGISTWTMNNHVPVYMDQENSVRIVEMRSPVTIAMNCQLTVLCKDYGYAIPNQIFNMYDNGACYQLNDLYYDYPVPKAFVSLLYTLWQMDRRKGKLKGISFREYVQMHTENRWQVHINRDIPSEIEIVVPSPMTQMLGSLEYNDDKPQIEQNNRLAVGFQIPFVYTIQFNSPTIAIMQIPSVYNNQKVPERLIMPTEDDSVRHNAIQDTRVSYAHENYNRSVAHSFPRPAHIPPYDEFTIPNNSPQEAYSQRAFYISLLGVDEENEQPIYTTIDVCEDTEAFAFPNVVKEVLYQEGEEAVFPDGIFTVQLYRSYKALLPGLDYQFNSDLQLKFMPMNLHDQYRVVLSAALDLSKVNKKWWWLIDLYWPWFNRNLQEQYARWYTSVTGENYDWYNKNRKRPQDLLPPGDTAMHPVTGADDHRHGLGDGSYENHGYEQSTGGDFDANLLKSRITHYDIIAERSGSSQTRDSA